MKDRETAFRTSEHPSQRMAVWVSPVPLPLPLYNSSPFLLDAPACSVGDSKCNSLGLVSSDLQPGTKKRKKRKKLGCDCQKDLHLSSTVVLSSVFNVRTDSSSGSNMETLALLLASCRFVFHQRCPMFYCYN